MKKPRIIHVAGTIYAVSYEGLRERIRRLLSEWLRKWVLHAKKEVKGEV